jgi:DNA-binding LytR/AlgR family response regulator
MNVSRDYPAFESNTDAVKGMAYSVKKRDYTDQKRKEYHLEDILLVRNQHRLVKLQVKDILYIEGKGNYVSLITGKGKILTLQTLKKLEDFLAPYQFVRIHKSFIVSFHWIDFIDNQFVYINKTKVPISDSYRDSFRAFLADNAKQI